MRAQPEQQAPPAQRLRFRYAKRGRLRFTSHRDFSRAFERALARAALPMAYSSGFHPHPRISYAGAAPTGSASEAEYVEIGLAREISPQAALVAIDEALPAGLDVLAVVETPTQGRTSLADLLTGSRWRMDIFDADPASLAAAVDTFLGQDQVLVQRMTKKGMREFDCRAATVSLSAQQAGVEAVLRHGVPAVRPDDLLTGIGQAGGAEFGRALFTRLEQGVLHEASGTIADPFG